MTLGTRLWMGAKGVLPAAAAVRMPTVRTIMLAAVFAFLGVGCDEDHRDDTLRAQKEKEAREKEDAEVRGNPDKLAAKAGKLEADIAKYKDNVAYWEGKHAEADAKVKGGNEADPAYADLVTDRNLTDLDLNEWKTKLNNARAELDKTRQWMIEASANEAGRTAAKNSGETSRQIARPPAPMTPPNAGHGRP